MAAINFPNSPTQGDTFTANDKTWVYLDGKWAFQTGETPLPVSVASPTSGQFLKWNGTAWVNDTIDLGADTAGSFVASLVAGTGVTLANNSGEASTPTVTVDTTVIAPLASPTFTGTVSGVTKTMVGLGNVDNTSDANKPVSTAQQTALDLKAPIASPTFTGTVTVPTPIGNTDASTKAYVDSTASTTASNASTALTNHDADTTNIHGIVDTSILVTTTGTQTLTNKTITSPAGLAKGDVGLGNVDNTSDANKPVSTAGQTALDLKSNLASPTFTGTVTANDLTVSGNLTVSGTTTSINTEILTVNDNIVVLNNNATGAPSENAGIEIERGSSTNVALRWNETSDKWELTNNGSNYADIATETYAASLTPATLDAIGDVTITSAASGQFLKWNGSAWVNDSVPVINNLNDIGDVTITSPAAGQTIQWNGSAWVNVTPTGTTVTTTANRSTDIPSPFTGQLIVLTDTRKIQLYDGTSWVNVSLAPPETPTSLSATALHSTAISVAFTAGGANGSPITNYKYALSTDSGSTYGSFTALSPEDITTPITISGLTAGTAYYIKLKAVNDMGDSVASAAVSISTLATPDAPTSLSAGSITISSVAISFTAGSDNGYAISNYQYALSTDSGSTYGSFTALDPVDATSPITITGLTTNTSYYVKLKAVNSGGAGTESSAFSFSTIPALTIEYLVIAGGGAGAPVYPAVSQGGGGGAGGYRSSVVGESSGGGASAETRPTMTVSSLYAITVGGGGSNSSFSNITSNAGGAGSQYGGGASGGSGGGGAVSSAGGAGTANQGFAGGSGGGGFTSGPGGGAGSSGSTGSVGTGVTSSITGSAITRAGGGGGSAAPTGIGGGGNFQSSGGTANTGGGGGGEGGAGGSGVVILRYPSAYTITIGAGLTGTTATVSTDKVTTITAGSGNVSWA